MDFFEDDGPFGDLLARYRTEAGKSQQSLADCLGVHRSTIVKWEQGNQGSLPKNRTRIEEIVRCLNLKDPQREVLFKAALLPLPHFIQNLPYHRNPFFTGRDQDLERLHVQLQKKQTTAIGQIKGICGLGGIGKTQLAVEYAYRHLDEYQYLLWASAQDVEALIASFARLADLLNLPEKNVQEQAIMIHAVKRWLQRQRSWLLILDNADHPDLLPDFLPSTVGGHVLITTRRSDLNAYLPSLAHPLVIDIFSDEQSALFLLHRSGLLALDASLDQVELGARQLAFSIVRELGGLPLALDQAGAYLHTTSCSLATYQQLYQQRRIQLLNQRRVVRDDHPEPVATTWDISFRNVEQQNPAAADLLRFCTFLAPYAIPEEILTKGAKGPGPVLGPVVDDPYLFNEAIEALRMYSLINRDPHVQALSIHPLVQVVLRDSMSLETQQQWAQRAFRAVNTAFPDIDFANWSICERLLPHALICTTSIGQTLKASPSVSRLLNGTGSYLYKRGRYEEAEAQLLRSLTIDTEVYGADHPEVATALNNLAEIYKSQGRYEEAGQLIRQALAIREQALGPMHIDTAQSLNNLATLYSYQGNYEEEEPLLQQALGIWEQKQGLSHPDVARALNNLAQLYVQQGKYAEGEPLARRTLEIDEQMLGPGHPDTSVIINTLANLYWMQGKDAEAELLIRRGLEIREQTLGYMHPSTALSLTSLAVQCSEHGKYSEAESLAQQALAIYEQMLGSTHPETGRCLEVLAGVYQQQGKYAEAEPLAQQALTIYEQMLGPGHPDTAPILYTLANLCLDIEKYAEAEPLAQRALTIYQQQLGINHPHTALCLNTLAKLYWRQGKHSEAEPLYSRALEICEQQLGRDHPTTLLIRKNYVLLLRTLGRDDVATKLENQENREETP